jgi:hypothetical protein
MSYFDAAVGSVTQARRASTWWAIPGAVAVAGTVVLVLGLLGTAKTAAVTVPASAEVGSGLSAPPRPTPPTLATPGPDPGTVVAPEQPVLQVSGPSSSGASPGGTGSRPFAGSGGDHSGGDSSSPATAPSAPSEPATTAPANTWRGGNGGGADGSGGSTPTSPPTTDS